MHALPLYPNDRREWRVLLLLYAGCSTAYYLATWYAYGGWSPGHPPLWNVEEFFASTGVKYLSYLLVSYALFCAAKHLPGSARGMGFVCLQFFTAVVFVVVSRQLQNLFVDYFAWAHFFGGRLWVFDYLLAGSFYALQLACLLLTKAHFSRNSLTAPEPEPGITATTVLARKGKYEVLLDWAEIVTVRAYGNYARALHRGETYLLPFGIGRAAERVPGRKWMRVHRSHLINLDHVLRLERSGRRHIVVMDDGQRVPIGARFLPAVKALGH